MWDGVITLPAKIGHFLRFLAIWRIGCGPGSEGGMRKIFRRRDGKFWSKSYSKPSRVISCLALNSSLLFLRVWTRHSSLLVGSEKSRSISWISWQRLCKSEFEGGMGFHDLETFNLTIGMQMDMGLQLPLKIHTFLWRAWHSTCPCFTYATTYRLGSILFVRTRVHCSSVFFSVKIWRKCGWLLRLMFPCLTNWPSLQTGFDSSKSIRVRRG